jgi:hypothetical protein
MKYSVTLMNSKGKEVKPPTESRTQTSLGLAIAYAHKQLSTVNNPKTSALIRELSPDNTSKVVKVVNLSDRRTTVYVGRVYK